MNGNRLDKAQLCQVNHGVGTRSPRRRECSNSLGRVPVTISQQQNSLKREQAGSSHKPLSLCLRRLVNRLDRSQVAEDC